MPAGYKAFYPWGAPTMLSDEDSNKVMKGMADAVCDEFLPSRGFRPDNNFERDWWLRPTSEAQQHYFITAHLIQTWIKENAFGDQEAAVFILGPFFGNPETAPGKQGVVVFFSFENKYQLYTFFREMAEFLKKKMPRIVEDLKLEVTA